MVDGSRGVANPFPVMNFLTTALARHSAKQMATNMPLVGPLWEAFQDLKPRSKCTIQRPVGGFSGCVSRNGTLNPLISYWDESFPRVYLFFVGGSIKFETHLWSSVNYDSCWGSFRYSAYPIPTDAPIQPSFQGKSLHCFPAWRIIPSHVVSPLSRVVPLPNGLNGL